MGHTVKLAQHQFLSFRTVFDLDQANSICTLLRNEGVEAELSNAVSGFSKVYLGSGVESSYTISLHASDFNQAELILRKDSENAISFIKADHYLYQFTSEELQDIIGKADEWSSLDVLMAEKILKERGHTYELDVDKVRNLRLEALAEPSDASELIVLGYVFALITDNVVGALIGVMLWTLKKTLPDGNRVHRYSKTDRNHGMIIFSLGLMIFLIKILVFQMYTGVISIFSWIQ